MQPQTLAWLKRYGLRWDLLVMRSRGDYAQVTDFKQAVVEDLRSHGFDLRLAFEDDPSNHAMYVAAGVPCVYIHSGLLRLTRRAQLAGPAGAERERREDQDGEVTPVVVGRHAPAQGDGGHEHLALPRACCVPRRHRAR